MTDTDEPKVKRRPGRPRTGQTPGHNVPMPADRWERLGDAAEVAGSDRTKILNGLAAWFVREPNAKLPKRPDLMPEPAPDKDAETG